MLAEMVMQVAAVSVSFVKYRFDLSTDAML